MSDLLELKNVTKVYSRGLLSRASTTALSDVSLKLESDQPTIMTVAGESGSGKTTMAMLLLGFITPTTGQILYKGKDIHTLRGEERMVFRREVQAVFQDPFAVFNPFYTVDHLLTVPIQRFKLAKSKKSGRDGRTFARRCEYTRLLSNIYKNQQICVDEYGAFCWQRKNFTIH